MPRSAADATRFTATGPHAHSKPLRSSASSTAPGAPSGLQPSSSSPSSSARSSGPPGETPQQKVARIKAAAQRAKLDQVSTFDKIVVRGRVWADRAHTVVALSLIGASVLCGIYATVALSDMIMYNRRKRREFYNAQTDLYLQHLAEANDAATFGTATESQMRLLASERAIEQEEQDKKDAKLWNRSKRWLLGDLKRDDDDSTEGQETRVERATAMSSRTLTGRGAAEGEVLKAVRELEVEKQQARDRKEGMLDAIGAEAAQSVSQSVASVAGNAESGSGGWLSWFRSTKGENDAGEQR